jgi:hypothetical protein
VGGPNLGSTVPRLTPGLFAEYKDRIARCTITDALFFWPVCSFPSAAGGVLCRRSRVGAAVAAEQSGQWGVSDPHLAAPFFAPRPALRGRSHPTCMSRSSGETARCR